MRIEYAIIVKNKTRLETLIDRFNTRAQARFYIESLGGHFEDYEDEHEIFEEVLLSVQTQLSSIIKQKTIERKYVSSFIFSENQFIVVVGQDGLVANTAKYSRGIPIVAVNPDQRRYDGVLLPFESGDFLNGAEQVISGKAKIKTARFAEAILNDGQKLLAFNDLFIGAATHISARYRITFQNQSEEHSSSGLIISTAAGSTGWLSSIFNMSNGISEFIDGASNEKGILLTESELMFAVREPFKSQKTQAGICAGIISGKDELIIESLMPANGVIFSDGIESDFLSFNSGFTARVKIAEETAKLVQNPQL